MIYTQQNDKILLKLLTTLIREGTFFIGGGGPGLRRGGSFVNILQIWEGQTCFICNRGRVIVSWQGKKILLVG